MYVTQYDNSPNEGQQDEGDLTKYNCSVIVIGQYQLCSTQRTDLCN